MANYEDIPRGQLSTVILSCLLDKDKYGYEIIDEVLKNTNGKVSIKQPSLYSNLKRMEDQSLISSYWRDSEIGGRRHYYHLTDLGKKYLEKWNVTPVAKEEKINDEPKTHFAQQENLFNLTSSKTDSKVETNNSIDDTNQSNSFIQFDLFSNNNIISSPASEAKQEIVLEDEIDGQIIESEANKINDTNSQKPILTSYEKDDSPKINKFEYVSNTNKSFSETISSVNTVSKKRYMETKSEENVIKQNIFETTKKEDIATSQSIIKTTKNDEGNFPVGGEESKQNYIYNNFKNDFSNTRENNIVENQSTTTTVALEEENKDYNEELQSIKVENSVDFNTISGYIPRQEPAKPVVDEKHNMEHNEEADHDDGVFITERIDVGNLPKSTPWNRRFDFYVSGNSISKDITSGANVEDRVKQLYEESMQSSENKKIETIDSKINFTSYLDLQKFYQNQNIKFKPYQKTLKKNEQNMDMIRISKLNFLTTLCVFGIYVLISLICGFSFCTISNAYLNCPLTFIVYPALLFIPVIFTFLTYIKIPQKKVAKVEQFKFNTTLAGLSILLIPIIFAINLFAGFTFANFSSFAICIIYPIFISLTYFVYYFVQKLLIKSRKMY